MRNRTLVSTGLGGAAMYFFDHELGEARRQRLLDLWRENRGSRRAVGRGAGQAAQTAAPATGRMSKAFGRGDRCGASDRRKRSATLPKLVFAVAIGGFLVYVLHPDKGLERRQRLTSLWQQTQQSALEAGRRAANQTAEVLKPQDDRVSAEVSDTVKGVRSKVR